MKPFLSIGLVGLICLLLIPAGGNSKARGQSPAREAKTSQEQDGWQEFRVFHQGFPAALLTFVDNGTKLVTAESWWPGPALMLFDDRRGDMNKTEGRHPLGFSHYGENLWDLTKVNEKVTFQAKFANSYFFVVSPDGKTVATEDQSPPNHFGFGLVLSDLTLGKESCKVERLDAPVRSLAFAPDGKTLASGHYDSIIRFWDVSADKKKMVLRSKLDIQKGGVTCLAFSPDGKTLATGSYDATITLWDVATSKALATLRGHRERLIALAYSSDGKTLASIGGDGGVKLWDPSTAKERAALQGIREATALAFSPDGKILAFCRWENPDDERSTAVVMLCDAVSGKKRTALQTKMDPPKSLAFSQDGTMLAVSGSASSADPFNQGLVMVWKRD
jgi:WD40 repeat protein